MVVHESNGARGQQVGQANLDAGNFKQARQSCEGHLSQQSARSVSLTNRRCLRLVNQVTHTATLVHFLPSLVQFGDSYGQGAFRVHAWSQAIARLGDNTSVLLAVFCGIAGTLASGLAAGGVTNQFCTWIALPAWYILASLNGLHTQTLGLAALWAVLSLYAILGEADAKIWRDRFTWAELHAALLSAYFLGTLFFSGIQKVTNGWPTSGTMLRLLNYPDVGLLRAWVVVLRDEFPKAVPFVGNLVEPLVLAAELGLPVLVIIPSMREASVLAYAAFFASVWSVLAIPPLFAMLYIAAALTFRHLPGRGGSYKNGHTVFAAGPPAGGSAS